MIPRKRHNRCIGVEDTMLNRLFTSVSLLQSVLFITLATLLSVNLFGQAETAQITGTVYDPSGAAIPAAAVTVKSVDTGALRGLTTSASGAYIATDLLPGDYLVTATSPGFVQIQQHVTATVGAKLALDL